MIQHILPGLYPDIDPAIRSAQKAAGSFGIEAVLSMISTVFGPLKIGSEIGHPAVSGRIRTPEVSKFAT